MKKIFIIDDDPSALEMLKEMLKSEGYEIITYNEPKRALTDLTTGKECHLLLTDIGMPELDGYSLYMELKKQLPDLPVVFMTGFGYDFKHTIIKAKLEGLKYCLYKPFKMEKLVKIIKQAIL